MDVVELRAVERYTVCRNECEGGRSQVDSDRGLRVDQPAWIAKGTNEMRLGSREVRPFDKVAAFGCSFVEMRCFGK
jgi:hypothetical protein